MEKCVLRLFLYSNMNEVIFNGLNGKYSCLLVIFKACLFSLRAFYLSIPISLYG